MASEKEKMLTGKLYDADDPELVEDRRRAREFTRRYNRTSEDDRDCRQRMVDELLGSLGDDYEIESPFRCDYGYNIHVGTTPSSRTGPSSPTTSPTTSSFRGIPRRWYEN
ncbi:maltose acetyltransferase domain-containing protein [Halomontanus rarus]|uniref:maltose acetyltransferase domain-containing protein n=1 Tax=Halomontanus rarus TaxID=3034020 RepID=UPI003CE58773